MNEVETIVRKFHESWDLKDPDRGAAVIAEDCRFEDVARGELLPGPEAYKRDYIRWRTAFPDGALEITNVIVQGNWAVVEFTNRGTQTGPHNPHRAIPIASGRLWKCAIAPIMVCRTSWLFEVQGLLRLRPVLPGNWVSLAKIDLRRGEDFGLQATLR